MALVVCWWFHFDGAKWILCIGLFPFILGIGWHHSTERLLLEFIILCDGSFDLVVHRCDERLDLGERFEFLFLFVILSYFILSSSLFFFLNYVLFAWRFQFRYILRSRSFFAAYLTFISPSLSLSVYSTVNVIFKSMRLEWFTCHFVFIVVVISDHFYRFPKQKHYFCCTLMTL